MASSTMKRATTMQPWIDTMSRSSSPDKLRNGDSPVPRSYSLGSPTVGPRNWRATLEEESRKNQSSTPRDNRGSEAPMWEDEGEKNGTDMGMSRGPGRKEGAKNVKWERTSAGWVRVEGEGDGGEKEKGADIGLSSQLNIGSDSSFSRGGGGKRSVAFSDDEPQVKLISDSERASTPRFALPIATSPTGPPRPKGLISRIPTGKWTRPMIFDNDDDAEEEEEERVDKQALNARNNVVSEISKGQGGLQIYLTQQEQQQQEQQQQQLQELLAKSMQEGSSLWSRGSTRSVSMGEEGGQGGAGGGGSGSGSNRSALSRQNSQQGREGADWRQALSRRSSLKSGADQKASWGEALSRQSSLGKNREEGSGGSRAESPVSGNLSRQGSLARNWQEGPASMDDGSSAGTPVSGNLSRQGSLSLNWQEEPSSMEGGGWANPPVSGEISRQGSIARISPERRTSLESWRTAGQIPGFLEEMDGRGRSRRSSMFPDGYAITKDEYYALASAAASRGDTSFFQNGEFVDNGDGETFWWQQRPSVTNSSRNEQQKKRVERQQSRGKAVAVAAKRGLGATLAVAAVVFAKHAAGHLLQSKRPSFEDDFFMA